MVLSFFFHYRNSLRIVLQDLRFSDVDGQGTVSGDDLDTLFGADPVIQSSGRAVLRFVCTDGDIGGGDIRIGVVFKGLGLRDYAVDRYKIDVAVFKGPVKIGDDVVADGILVSGNGVGDAFHIVFKIEVVHHG